ncbi:hypothetical protein KKC47_02285, partial [Patescibacteria group bacterium]|nr:hypothetical protein [Patescibacteria group bacterium]
MYHPKRTLTKLFLSALLLTAAFAVTTCTHPPGGRIPRSPECVYVPDPPENPPEDPFVADQDDDGLNE